MVFEIVNNLIPRQSTILHFTQKFCELTFVQISQIQNIILM